VPPGTQLMAVDGGYATEFQTLRGPPIRKAN